MDNFSFGDILKEESLNICGRVKYPHKCYYNWSYLYHDFFW